MGLDERLKEWATPTQAKYLDAINLHGSARSAAKALGVNKSAVSRAIQCLKAKAARNGFAPGHWTTGVAPGYVIGKVTVQEGPNGVERLWKRQHPEAGELISQIREAIDAMKEEIPPPRPTHRTGLTGSSMLTQYTITDYHMGELCHAVDGDGRGADWNLDLAESLLVGAIEHLAAKSPDSDTAVLALLGDLLHYDGPDPVTPTSRHPVHPDGSQRRMVRATVRSVRRVIQHLLTKHAHIKVVVMEGNHDLAGTPWLQEILLTHYEAEPRVEISDNTTPFFAMQFGCNFLGFHHGHRKKKEALPILFAAMFRQIWGLTTKGYIHTGHLHQVDEKEHPGVKVLQHPTLQAPGHHTLSGGWMSEREMTAIHYHADFGQVGRATVTPEMLSEAA